MEVLDRIRRAFKGRSSALSAFFFVLYSFSHSDITPWLALCVLLGAIEVRIQEVDFIVGDMVMLRWSERRAGVAFATLLIVLKILRSVMWSIPIYVALLYVFF